MRLRTIIETAQDQVIKDRWPEAEPTIMRSHLADEYKDFIGSKQ